MKNVWILKLEVENNTCELKVFDSKEKATAALEATLEEWIEQDAKYSERDELLSSVQRVENGIHYGDESSAYIEEYKVN